MSSSPFSLSTAHLENHFNLNRCPERKAGHAAYKAARVLLFSENILQKVGGGIRNLRQIRFAVTYISPAAQKSADTANRP
jgi:hypothetical protein